MPLANVYSTTEAQRFLIHKVQNPLVTLMIELTKPKNILVLIGLFIGATQIAWELYRMRRPTKDTVNKHNSKVLVGLRDDFMAHQDNSMGSRCHFYDIFLSFVAHKYDWDNSMARRLNYWLRKWKESDWIDDGKNPETSWNLTEEEKSEPTEKRYRALQSALDNKEWDKVYNLVD